MKQRKTGQDEEASMLPGAKRPISQNSWRQGTVCVIYLRPAAPVSRCLPVRSAQRTLAASAFMEMCRWGRVSVWHWDVSRGGTRSNCVKDTNWQASVHPGRPRPLLVPSHWAQNTSAFSVLPYQHANYANVNAGTRNHSEATWIFFSPFTIIILLLSLLTSGVINYC